MKCPHSKWISAAAGEVDKEYRGYKTANEPNTVCFATILYKGNGVAWRWGDEKQIITNITFLDKEMDWQETAQWYKDQFDITDPKTSNNLIGLFTDLYGVADAYHEMWNGWVDCDFYEMAAELSDEDFYLVGIAPAPWSKDDIFGKGKSVAFIAEYYDSGERFWCHGSLDWVEGMREQMEDIYEEMKI